MKRWVKSDRTKPRHIINNTLHESANLDRNRSPPLPARLQENVDEEHFRQNRTKALHPQQNRPTVDSAKVRSAYPTWLPPIGTALQHCGLGSPNHNAKLLLSNE